MFDTWDLFVWLFVVNKSTTTTIVTWTYTRFTLQYVTPFKKSLISWEAANITKLKLNSMGALNLTFHLLFCHIKRSAGKKNESRLTHFGTVSARLADSWKSYFREKTTRFNVFRLLVSFSPSRWTWRCRCWTTMTSEATRSRWISPSSRWRESLTPRGGRNSPTERGKRWGSSRKSKLEFCLWYQWPMVNDISWDSVYRQGAY